MEVIITTLIENKLEGNLNLWAEHGLSIHIEIDGINVLFDTGQTGKFLENSKILNVDLKKTDYVFMSHGHYDHTGGFEKFVEDIGAKFRLFVGKDFFNEKYKMVDDGKLVFIGNSFNKDYLEQKKISVKYVSEDILEISENLMVFTNFIGKDKYVNVNETMFVKNGEDYEIDRFPDEISLGVKTEKGLIVIVGCAHIGVANILETISERTGLKIYGLIGGTHLIAADENKIHNTANYLEEKGIELIGVSHCTGEKAENILMEKFTDKFFKNNTGTKIVFAADLT